MITMTTVGYGDMSARTPFGKAISIITAVLGFLEFALPAAVFTKNFYDYFAYLSKKQKAIRNIKRKDGFKKLKKESLVAWLSRRSSVFSQNSRKNSPTLPTSFI